LITFTYTWIVNVKRWCGARAPGTHDDVIMVNQLGYGAPDTY